MLLHKQTALHTSCLSFSSGLTLVCAASQNKQLRRAHEPRLLVCHDLDGNYHSDALPQGDDNSGYYRLTDWGNIDVFVYFSHALVTIPPVGWVNAAHRNSVPVSMLEEIYSGYK